MISDSTVRKPVSRRAQPTRTRHKSLGSIVRALRRELPALNERYHLRSLGIFGSFARGNPKPSSDVDVLVEFAKSPALSRFLDLQEHLSLRLGTKVDLHQIQDLKPYIGKHVARQVLWLQKDGAAQSVKRGARLTNGKRNGGSMEPAREYLDFIEDMIVCMENAPRHVEGMSYKQRLADRKTLLAVRSEVMMIGEAASRIPANIRERYPEIPWKDMIGARHRIVHGYDKVDYKVIWEILKESIPHDLPLVREMLAAETKRRKTSQ